MPRGVRGRALSLAAIALLAGGVSGCGDDAERQDADEPEGEFPV